MSIVKKLGVFIGSLILAAGVNIAQAADATAPQLKVAIVNVQQVLQQSPRVAALSKKLESQFKTRQTKINDEQKALQDAMDAFKKNEPTMAQKDKDATAKKIEADRADLVKQVMAYQQDLQKEQARIMQGIQGDLTGIVSTIAKSKSYSLVLDSQAVIFANDGNDITKDVATEFNSKS